MIEGMILLADGFEITEALTTQDVLSRTGKIHCTLVNTMGKDQVTSSSNVRVLTDIRLEVLRPDDYAFVILPGGKLGVDNLAKNPAVIELIKKFHAQNKEIFAICAAPSILGNLGYLDGKNYTCFPGFERGNGTYHDVGAIEDGKIITGHSMGYSIVFGEKIIAHFLGEEGVASIQKGVKGLRN